MATRRAPEPVLEIFPPDPSATSPPSTAPQHEPDDREAGTLRLASGRSLQWQALDDGTEHVRIHGVGGDVELDVVFTENGPRLRFKAADLALEADGKVQVDCDEFHVRSKGDIVHEADGNMGERVEGNAITVVRGNYRVSACTAGVRATRGDVRLKANDDVKLEGERIKLNC
jgi:hypothetical protein